MIDTYRSNQTIVRIDRSCQFSHFIKISPQSQYGEISHFTDIQIDIYFHIPIQEGVTSIFQTPIGDKNNQSLLQEGGNDIFYSLMLDVMFSIWNCKKDQSILPIVPLRSDRMILYIILFGTTSLSHGTIRRSAILLTCQNIFWKLKNQNIHMAIFILKTTKSKL